MKEVEMDRLLNLDRAALCAVFADVPDPDIATAPEILHVLLLRREQFLKSLGRDAIQAPLGASAKLFSRSHAGRVIDHVFREVDRTIGPGLDLESNLAGVLRIGNFMGMRAL